MALSPKVIASITTGVVGGGGSVPLALWQTGVIGGTTKTTQQPVLAGDSGGHTHSYDGLDHSQTSDLGKPDSPTSPSPVTVQAPDSGLGASGSSLGNQPPSVSQPAVSGPEVSHPSVGGRSTSSDHPPATSVGPSLGSEPAPAPLPPTVSPSEESKICIVTEDLDKDIRSQLRVSEDHYTTLSCVKTNSEDSTNRLADKWTGFFPNDLFSSSRFSHEEGEKINLETSTTGAGGEIQTIFKGGNKLMKQEITGEWGQTQEILGMSVTIVKVQEEALDVTDPIYLVLPKRVDS